MLVFGKSDTLPGSREVAVEQALARHHYSRLIGHSLGGFVAAKHAREVDRVVAYNPGYAIGFPQLDNIEIKRHPLDIVSMFAARDPRTRNAPMTAAVPTSPADLGQDLLLWHGIDSATKMAPTASHAPPPPTTTWRSSHAGRSVVTP
jgi:dienelactone hydrolase